MARHQSGDSDIAMSKARWNLYLATAREKYEEIDSAERYKEEDLAEALTSAREALLHDGDWMTLVNAAIKHKWNNIIHWRNQSKLTKWIDDNAAEASSALSELWSEGDRVRSFDVILPETVFPRTAVGTRPNAASYLVMAIDPHSYRSAGGACSTHAGVAAR